MGSLGVPEGEVSQVAYGCLSDGVCETLSRIYSHLKVVSLDCYAPGFSQLLSCVVTSVYHFGRERRDEGFLGSVPHGAWHSLHSHFPK